MRQPFEKQLLIPFHLVDAAGILFFGHVWTLAHQAYEEWVMDHLHIPWAVWFQNADWIVPVKHCEADYFSPIRAGELCCLKVSLKEVRASSFEIEVAFTQKEVLCCVARTVHVFCQKTPLQKIPIPLDIARKFDLLDEVCTNNLQDWTAPKCCPVV